MASAKSIVVDPLSGENPITVQMLGICSALAVTVLVETAIVMSIAVIVVLCASNTIISCIRNIIPNKIRLVVQMLVVASLVILVDQVLQAFAYEVSKGLSVFVGLIITNCIVMGRAEGFAMQNPPGLSFLDGLGNGIGYGIVLILVGSLREILGAGTWNGMRVFPESYMGNGLAVLAPGAFIIIGLIIWIQRTFATDLVEED